MSLDWWKSAPNRVSSCVRRLFKVCVRVFCAPKVINFACLHTRQDKMSFIWKDDFIFAKIDIFCKSIVGPLPSVVQAYTQPYSFGLWIKIRTKQWLVLDASASPPNATILLVYIPAKIKISFIWKDDFFLPKSASSVSRSIFVRRKDKTSYLSNQTWAKCYHSRNKH